MRGPDEILDQVQRVTRMLGLSQVLDEGGLQLAATLLLIQRLEAVEAKLDEIHRQLGPRAEGKGPPKGPFTPKKDG